MLLQSDEAAARKPIFIARHLPVREDGAEDRVVRTEHGGTMGLIRIMRRIPGQPVRCASGQGLAELLKVLAHRVRGSVLVGQGKEERFLEFSMSGKKLLRPAQRVTVIPLQARTYGDVGVEQVGAGDEGVDGQRPTKRMARGDAGSGCAGAFLDFGNQFGLDEIEEAVRTATGGEGSYSTVGILDVGVRGS